MNFETDRWSRDALETDALSDEDIARRRRRRLLIGAAAIGLLLAIAAFLMLGRGPEEPAAAPPEGAAPSVTVVVPGRQQISRTINATGSLAARRDLPVSVSGEGGMVSRVLVEPGQWVAAGQTLAVIERSVQTQQAAQLGASIEVTRADARLAQQELDRAQSLVSRGFISKADVERRTATRDAANARVRVAQAQLGETRARIGRLDIRAPAAGLVLSRSVEAGQVVGAGSGALFRIAQGGQMELVARLPQEDLARITPGMPAKATPVGSSQSFDGSVWQVSPVIDPQTRQGAARVALAYDPLLRPGGFAAVSIQSGAIDATLLPESAVLNDDSGSFVYIVGRDNVVQRRAVEVGSVIDAGVVISKGISGTERVVLSAGAFLTPGDKIKPQRAAAR